MHTTRAKRFAKLDWLVVQEIFMTETCYHADVILPATAWPEKSGTVTNTDRMVQHRSPGIATARRRQTGSLDHPGNRAPHGISWNYEGPKDVFNEMRKR
jgi:formate dehydrogenase major subunit